MVQAMIQTREKEERQRRPMRGGQGQGRNRVLEREAEVFDELAPLVEEPFETIRVNKEVRPRVDVEAERIRANDPSRLYRDEVGHADLLTPEEVNRLAQCIERGRVAATRPSLAGHRELIEAGERAKQRLVEANLRLVIHVARRYKGFEMDLMDLIQEG